MLEAARGDWANYVKASILRLQEQFRDRRLRGMDMMVSGDIPMGAGLSSSSALVVATAEAVTAFNRLPVSAPAAGQPVRRRRMVRGHPRRRGGPCRHQTLAPRLCHARGFLPVPDRGLGAASCPGTTWWSATRASTPANPTRRATPSTPKSPPTTSAGSGSKCCVPTWRRSIEHLRDITPSIWGSAAPSSSQLLAQLPARMTRAQSPGRVWRRWPKPSATGWSAFS